MRRITYVYIDYINNLYTHTQRERENWENLKLLDNNMYNCMA